MQIMCGVYINLFKNIVLSIIAILIVSMILGYSIWLNTLESNVNINIARFGKLVIGSYKVFINFYSNNCNCLEYRGVEDNQITLSIDNRSISIMLQRSIGEVYNLSMWIGLVISNEGGVPVNAYSFRVLINGFYGEYFTNHYFYGPYKTGLGYREWGRVDPCQLPFINYNQSIVIDSDWKTIAWINIVVLNIFSITNTTITIQYTLWNNI